MDLVYYCMNIHTEVRHKLNKLENAIQPQVRHYIRLNGGR
jgi:hypothetical protein